jgi:hypothetical protein
MVAFGGDLPSRSTADVDGILEPNAAASISGVARLSTVVRTLTSAPWEKSAGIASAVPNMAA